jgi:2-polyprenyl-6-methoxyphenol hydroxylase-like FAD-dependent oxidoreductase
MTLPRRTDVLIAGAGPTGLALAAYLRAAGIEAVIVDRAARTGEESRAAMLHLRALELLDALGVGKALEALGTPVSTVAYFDMGVKVCDLDFASLGSHHPHALGIQQYHVEQVLNARLEELGGSVRRRSTLAEIEQREDELVATVVGARGARNHIAARYLVGCDGAHSTVRDLCNMEGKGTEIAQAYAIADAPIRGEFAPGTMHFYAAASGFAVVSPLQEGLWRLTATLPQISRVPTREELQLIISERGPRTSSIEIGPPVAAGCFRIQRVVAPSLRANRVFLAGDAAHTFSPATAQGMNTGIADAANLAWKLAAVLQDVAQESLLDSYDVERRPAALDAVERTDRYSGGLSTANPITRGIRDTLGLLAGRIEQLRLPMTEGLAGFDTHYKDGVLGRGRRVAGWGEVGKRVEQLPPALQGRRTFRLLGRNRSEAGQLKTFASRWPLEIDVGVLPTGGKGFALVRPDDHLAWLGGENRLPELHRLLERWFV